MKFSCMCIKLLPAAKEPATRLALKHRIAMHRGVVFCQLARIHKNHPTHTLHLCTTLCCLSNSAWDNSICPRIISRKSLPTTGESLCMFRFRRSFRALLIIFSSSSQSSSSWSLILINACPRYFSLERRCNLLSLMRWCRRYVAGCDPAQELFVRYMCGWRKNNASQQDNSRGCH